MLMKRYCLTFLQTETAFYSWGLRTLINGICTEVKLYILGSWKTLLMREFNISYVQVNQAWLKFPFLNPNIRNLIFMFLWSIFLFCFLSTN